jgi:phage FluMu protein Com
MADADSTERETVTSTVAMHSPAQPRRFEEWRCLKCRTLLAVIAIDSGTIQQTCKRCKTVNVIEVRDRRYTER